MTESDWDPSQITPDKIKVITRKPRWKKDGSMSRVHTRKVAGDLRDTGAGVGGSINTDHQGSTEKRPAEQAVENRLG